MSVCTHLDAIETVERDGDQALAILDAEERLLGDVGGDGDDQLVDEAQAAADDVLVSSRHGIEAAGVQSDAHNE